jgi:hypothetical protein
VSSASSLLYVLSLLLLSHQFESSCLYAAVAAVAAVARVEWVVLRVSRNTRVQVVDRLVSTSSVCLYLEVRDNEHSLIMCPTDRGNDPTVDSNELERVGRDGNGPLLGDQWTLLYPSTLICLYSSYHAVLVTGPNVAPRSGCTTVFTLFPFLLLSRS